MIGQKVGPASAAHGQGPTSEVEEVGYITDLEGDLATLERCLDSGQSVLRRGQGGQLELASDTSAFVFGGDLFDRGPGDLRLARALLDLKARHPDRVVLLMGNRDINKMRLTAELDADYLTQGRPEAAFSAWWDPAAPKLAEYLSSRGLPDSRENRLRWMLKCTLGSGGAFEHRRQELRELKLEGLAGAGDAEAVTDEEVADSFLATVEREDGEVAAYLANARIAAVFGDTLFVHGAAEERALGFVPSLATEYAAHSAGEVVSLPGAREGLPLREWVEANNAFAAAAVAQWRAEPRWSLPPDPAGDGGPRAAAGRRGGEALLAYQCRPAIAAKTVVVTCYVDGKNMPGRRAIHEDLKEGLPKCSDPLSPSAAGYLRAGGVRRVVVGHKPNGEAPAVLRSRGDDGLGYEVISADTNYASRSAPSFRGRSWCEVRVRLPAGPSSPRSQSRLRGALADGRGAYDFDLPPLGEGSEVLAGTGDPLVGCQTADGWWVRVRLDGAGEEARYLLSRGEGRGAESRVVAAADVKLQQHSRL
uniref:Calcineurin-like phosphoesterase domain-containing protein n=1 Tax=Alexandrium monilatum TaxID=311494 RepID=A0A7S4UK99_9DINO